MVSSIASDETLKEVRAAMRGVVEEGTGRILKSRYYKVGGKTGTAQIPVNGRYTDRNGGRHYLATMVGYFPEDDPKYSCLVALKTYNAPGHRRFYYGASLAGARISGDCRPGVRQKYRLAGSVVAAKGKNG